MLTESGFAMIDLFAGCGGLSLGMENAGFVPVFVSELDESAMATYLTNRHHLVGGRPFADQPNLRCRDANELQGDRLEQLVSDLESFGLRFPSKEDSEHGRGHSSLDLLAGGPPCQGYSDIGHRRSYPVDRRDLPSNLLYARMAAIIRRLRPRIFLFENVRGLLTAKWTRDGHEKIWPDVLNEFREIKGYSVRWSVVRAYDYGVPQNRPRVLLVGIRQDVMDACERLKPGAHWDDAVQSGFLPNGDPSECPDLEDLLSDLIDPNVDRILRMGDYPKEKFETIAYPSPPRTPIQAMLRAPAPAHEHRSRGELTDHEYSKHAPHIVAKFMHMIANGGAIPEHARTKKFNQRVLPRRFQNQLPTITATSLPDDYVHFSQPRSITVREWARIQLFPDWYSFQGKRTTGGHRRAGLPHQGIFDREVPKYTQIGNAVPVGLAERVGRHFRLLLEEAAQKAEIGCATDEPPLSAPLAASRRVAS
jgi:DNA (cytosine-5)-methyltransferase 1